MENKEAVPAQPSYPITNYNLTPQGLIITVQLDNCTAISHMILNEPLNEIRKLLKEREKQQQNQLALIRHINQSKNN